MIVKAIQNFTTPNGNIIREDRDYIAVAQKFVPQEDFYLVEIPNYGTEFLPQKLFRQKDGVRQSVKFIDLETGSIRFEGKYVA